MSSRRDQKIVAGCSSYDVANLEDLLLDRLPMEQTKKLEMHLEHCAFCQSQMDRLTATADDWDDLQSALLKPRKGPDNSSLSLSAIQSIRALLSPTDDPQMLGRLGHYEVSGIVGIGGMGVVCKGRDPALDRTVAIKVLLPHLAANRLARIRFLREARSAASIVHENVMPIFGIEDRGAVPFLVMPFSRGQTLQRRIDTEGPLSVQQVVRVGIQVARALAAAHAQGLIHRDVKPANIMLDEGTDRVLLADFGLARAIDDLSVTRSGMVAGTPLYMSPEQIQGETLSQKSDLFSLGSVMYAMCTGQTPFHADTSYGVMRQITDREPKDIQEINSEIPAWLCNIVRRLMAKSPADRFAAAERVAQLLEECLAHVHAPKLHRLPTCLAKPRFFERLNSYMSDKKILSLISFGLFLAALLIPWLIAATGKEIPAIVFGSISLFLAISFAVFSYKEFFSQIVLKLLIATIGLLMLGLLLAIPIWYVRSQTKAQAAMALEQQALARRNEFEAKRALQSARRDLTDSLVLQSETSSGSTKKQVLEWMVQRGFKKYTEVDMGLELREQVTSLMPDLKSIDKVTSLIIVPVLSNIFMYYFFNEKDELIDLRLNSILASQIGQGTKDESREDQNNDGRDREGVPAELKRF